ncbi:MAG: hypothetical protein WC055_08200 [Melioribacteraceae bacterium]
MAKLISVSPLGKDKIYLKYDDGLEGEYSLIKLMNKFEYEELSNELMFNSVSVCPKTNDVTWKNGSSICKNALYRQLELMQMARNIGLDLDKI